MVVFLLLLILLFLVGKSIVGAAFSVAGALICLLLVIALYFVKRKRR